MESMFEDDISILTQEALGPGEVWLDAPEDPSLGGDMCSASHFALITAYGDIKERLGGLERENATLRRRLKVYEIKYPLINDFGEEHSFSLYEIKDGSLLEVEKVSLQQRLNQFQQELQKNKEQEEQLREVIQAYEKLCVEKSDLETELSEMRALVETHLRQICGLEQQLRQQQGLRDAPFSSRSPPPAATPPCAELDVHYLALRGGSGLSHAGWPGPAPSVSELERRRLEEALEAAQGEARGAQLREEQLQAECERLQGELKQLQETRAQDLASNQSERDMAWVKRVGDDQVNLALAYTELTEELGRLRELSALQGRILRTLLQEPARSGGQRHSPLSQRHSPGPQCPSPSPPARAAPPGPPCQSPGPQRRSPAPPCPSPQQRRSPVPPPCQSPSPQRRSPAPPPPGPAPPPAERPYAKPPSHHAKAGFQGRRSYSELAEGAGYAGAAPAWLQAEAATLPKPRAYGGELYGAGRPLSPRRAFDGLRLRFEKQPSEEEEWAVPTGPPSPDVGTIRCASFCAGFPIPESPAATAYAHAEHAQSWPSINLLMETVGSDIRSCPLCQLGFPVGYPDDALIKHIDSHLENSKI
ncbi:TANK-binding kinase 1-binding protein 1 isoform X1 [Sorex araneus]|uniref:TANK-binding kinase 1-binding protein 1 isoform X1 n=1 Tax=Sorex araneus TaxID=42254 RepID=UPI002433CA14|nr:TANK-binding kinase 1-binding protein 1 isoform X1 [Sorex araneus]XP_054987983.1 TANK-binding kinase 1-binding protein 1 isoform X1 [Sorex araneus]